MDSRERVFRALEFGAPDRTPLSYNLSPGWRRRYAADLPALLAQFPADFAETGFIEFSGFTKQIGVPERDAWGVVWLRLDDDYMGQAVEHPLADWANLPGYEFPDPLRVGDWSRVPEALGRNQGRRYFLVDGDTLFQRLFYLRGFESLMLDIHYESAELTYVRDAVAEYMLRRLEKWCEYEIDGVRFRDDWGSQEALLIHPEKWRRLFKPVYRRLFAAVHAAGKHVWFHSDGNILPIVPDLIELGADVLNPQVAVVGLDNLARACAGRICIMGEVDRQTVMPLATPEVAAAYAHRVAAALGTAKGGCVGHTFVGPDVPLANLQSIWQAFLEHSYDG